MVFPHFNGAPFFFWSRFFFPPHLGDFPGFFSECPGLEMQAHLRTAQKYSLQDLQRTDGTGIPESAPWEIGMIFSGDK